MASQFLKSNRTGWLMAGPAVALITAFVIVPFIFAFALSFTNQRLISPNPTEFTGLTNYRQLLGMATLTLDPVTDASGGVKLAADGTAEYPAFAALPATTRTIPALMAGVNGRVFTGAKPGSICWCVTWCSSRP